MKNLLQEHFSPIFLIFLMIVWTVCGVTCEFHSDKKQKECVKVLISKYSFQQSKKICKYNFELSQVCLKSNCDIK